VTIERWREIVRETLGLPEDAPLVYLGSGVEANVFGGEMDGGARVFKYYSEGPPLQDLERLFRIQEQRSGPARGLPYTYDVVFLDPEEPPGVVVQERVIRSSELARPGYPSIQGVDARDLDNALHNVVLTLQEAVGDDDYLHCDDYWNPFELGELEEQLLEDLLSGMRSMDPRCDVKWFDVKWENVGIAERRGEPQAVLLDFTTDWGRYT